MKESLNLLQSQIEAIKETLSKGDRIELIPTKDGIKVLRVRREEIKSK